MKDLKPNSIVTRNMRRNANHAHPWMGLVIPNASSSSVRAQLPVTTRPIPQRATGPRDL